MCEIMNRGVIGAQEARVLIDYGYSIRSSLVLGGSPLQGIGKTMLSLRRNFLLETQWNCGSQPETIHELHIVRNYT